MEFILLNPGLILVVFVSRGGVVQNRFIEAEADLTQEDLDKYTRYLNELLADLTLKQVAGRVTEEMAREKIRFDAVLGKALRLGQKALGTDHGGEVFIEGRTNLMDAPEFSDIDRLRQIFVAFEEKSTLLRLLEKSMLARGCRYLSAPRANCPVWTALPLSPRRMGARTARWALWAWWAPRVWITPR